MDASLPTDGAALLAFKILHEPGSAGWGAAGVILDDPASRLAELSEFFSEDGDADEVAATQAANEASAALVAATTCELELAVWDSALRDILGTPDEEPELPVLIMPTMLLGDYEVAADEQASAAHETLCLASPMCVKELSSTPLTSANP